MDDRVGLGARHGLADTDGIKTIDDRRGRSQLADDLGSFGPRCGPGHLVAASDQHRHEPTSDGATGACDKDPHGWASFLISAPETRYEAVA